MVCGYDDFKKVFIVRNSWGDKLADKGYYYIPYDYITNEELCDDFWSIITVT
jgi:C1A family cysteine protease